MNRLAIYYILPYPSGLSFSLYAGTGLGSNRGNSSDISFNKLRGGSWLYLLSFDQLQGRPSSSSFLPSIWLSCTALVIDIMETRLGRMMGQRSQIELKRVVVNKDVRGWREEEMMIHQELPATWIIVLSAWVVLCCGFHSVRGGLSPVHSFVQSSVQLPTCTGIWYVNSRFPVTEIKKPHL